MVFGLSKWIFPVRRYFIALFFDVRRINFFHFCFELKHVQALNLRSDFISKEGGIITGRVQSHIIEPYRAQPGIPEFFCSKSSPGKG